MSKKKKGQISSVGTTDEIFNALIVKADDPDSAADVQRSRALAIDRQRELQFGQQDVIEPPFSPLSLCRLFEISNALRQNIEAYETNIDSFGYRFEPTIPLEGPRATKAVQEILLLQLNRMPTDDEVSSALEEIQLEAKKELIKIKNFFDFCVCDGTFITLRRKLRRDAETVGWATFEILRDKVGDIAQFVHVPACWVRLMPLGDSMAVEQKSKVSPTQIGTISMHRRFRTFVQMDDAGNFVFFKEFGDHRIMSSKSGRFFNSEEDLLKEEPESVPATELFYWVGSNFSLDTPYGKPRWIGNLLSVLGSREAEEVNFLYFQNKSVPPMAVLVMGGRLRAGVTKRIEDFVENHLRGKRNFHKILILEAMPFGRDDVEGIQHSGKARIELKPLTDAQLSDALFQNYDEKNRDKVGESFRLPRLIRGDIRDFNRSTATAALAFSETQVFQPERDLFDAEMDRKILVDLGIRFWSFKSLGPITKDSQAIAEMVERLVKVGVLTPEEGRTIAEDVFNRPFDNLEADWTKRPIALTLAGLGFQMAGNEEMSEVPRQPNRAFDPESNEEPTEKQNLSTADLDSGGKLKPAQGCVPGNLTFGVCPDEDDEEPKFFRLPIDKIEEDNGIVKVHVPTEEFRRLVDVDEQ